MQEENGIAREVVDAALKLHRHFGPGVYESVYEPVLIYESNKRSLTTRQQTPVPLIYEGITFDTNPNLCAFAPLREIFLSVVLAT
jgi:GxxExxY protein